MDTYLYIVQPSLPAPQSRAEDVQADLKKPPALPKQPKIKPASKKEEAKSMTAPKLKLSIKPLKAPSPSTVSLVSPLRRLQSYSSYKLLYRPFLTIYTLVQIMAFGHI